MATAGTGAEALLALKQYKPDAITMDLEMPEMNGLEALKQIMRIQPTPVIMISGISEDGTRETIKRFSWEPSILSVSLPLLLVRRRSASSFLRN